MLSASCCMHCARSRRCMEGLLRLRDTVAAGTLGAIARLDMATDLGEQGRGGTAFRVQYHHGGGLNVQLGCRAAVCLTSWHHLATLLCVI